MTLASASQPASLLQGVAISAVAGSAEWASSALQYGHLMAGLARERLSASSLQAAVPDHPLPFVTHPLLLRTYLDLKREKEGVLQKLAERSLEVQPYLIDPLDALFRHFGLRLDPEAIVQRCQSDMAFFDSHPLPMFDGINQRGIVDYDRELFGRDRMQTFLGELRPEMTRLWKILENLPRGAVVADWGGGAGIFGYELKKRRPDITMYVIDRHDPADALHSSMDSKSPDPRDVLSSIHPLIGNGEKMTLPGGQKADLVLSVHMSPYVNDALGLVAHLHNQLKPGGLLITTLAGHLFDTSATWLQWHKVHREVSQDLSGFGLQTRMTQEGRSHVIRRRDERILRRSARQVGSYSHVDILPMIGRRHSRLSLYEPVNRPIGRWLSLERP